MTLETSPLLYCYGPIWGASFNSEGCSVIGEDVVVCIPWEDEWRTLQKTDVWMERFRAAANARQLKSIEGPTPPVCLVVIGRLEKGEDFYDAVRRMGDSMIKHSEDAVLSLRLAKSGWFLDPKLSEITFFSDTSDVIRGSLISRIVGPYRQIFLGSAPEPDLPLYNLNADELPSEKVESTAVSELWKLIQRYRQHPNSSADIAIKNFNASYGYQLSSTHRAAFLFTALDAMFGGMSRKEVAGLKMKSKFRARIASALEALDQAHPSEFFFAITRETPSDIVEWLDSASCGGRYIRNAISHGRPSSVAREAEDSFDYLQAILRLLLRQFLEFSVKWADSAPVICDRFKIPYPCATAAAYNKILEAYAKGNDTLNLLRFSHTPTLKEGN